MMRTLRKSKRWYITMAVTAAIVICGVGALLRSGASGNFVATEPEDGTTSAPAERASDELASGGSAIVFKNPAGCSGNPSAPTNFKANPTSQPSIDMAWSASAAAPNCTIAGYRFWRATGETPPPPTGTPYADNLKFPDYSNTNVTFNATYSYTLVAFDTDGHVSEPITVTAKTPIESDWMWPVRVEDLDSATAGLAQCWLRYYAPRDGYHAAIDIKVTNKPVYAPHKGTVVGKYSDGYNTLIINTGNNPATGKTLYAVFEHMSAVSVQNGTTVTKGQRIGTSGEVGAPGAPHLHFGISDSASAFGTYANPWHTANPLDFLPNDYAPALLTNGSYSCKTSTIQSRNDFGFAKYRTNGTFSMYK